MDVRSPVLQQVMFILQFPSVGPRHLAAIVSVVTAESRDPAHYRRSLDRFDDLAHVTVEVHACDAHGARAA